MVSTPFFRIHLLQTGILQSVVENSNKVIKMINKLGLEQGYKTPIVTEETIKDILKHPRFFRGHIRTATANYKYT